MMVSASFFGAVFLEPELGLLSRSIIMKSAKYRSILTQNPQAPARMLKMLSSELHLHDNNPKHTSKSTK